MGDPFFKTRISLETGIPVRLLTASDPESCQAQAKLLQSIACGERNPPDFPAMYDSGECPRMPDTRSTGEKFAEAVGPLLAFDPFRRLW